MSYPSMLYLYAVGLSQWPSSRSCSSISLNSIPGLSQSLSAQSQPPISWDRPPQPYSWNPSDWAGLSCSGGVLSYAVLAWLTPPDNAAIHWVDCSFGFSTSSGGRGLGLVGWPKPGIPQTGPSYEHEIPAHTWVLSPQNGLFEATRD